MTVSPDQASRAFIRIGLLIAVLMFLVVGSDVLLCQWIIGYASATYIFGTAALLAGICVGVFALIAAVGLAIAAAFGRTEPADTSPERHPPMAQREAN